MATTNAERQRRHRGRVAEITQWWRTNLRRAGLPEHWTPACIGPRELESLKHLRAEDPNLYAVSADASRCSLTVPDPTAAAGYREVVGSRAKR